MRSIEVAAFAKVNLFLKVLGKRKDGYHDILTIFERIDLSDRIRISKTPSGIELTCDKRVTDDPGDNLAYKAARAILKKSGAGTGVRIHIRKNIPIAAGLGGGSSDAAAVLTGINRLLGLGLGKKALMKIGSGLGADVPFFILDEAFAIGRGIGDELDIIKTKARFWHLLVFPGSGISTKEVYEGFKVSKVLTRKGLDDKIRPSDPLLHNDLQEPAVRKKPIIGGMLRRLANLSVAGAIMSGSGPSVFCLYEARREAVEAKKRLFREVPEERRKHWRVFVTGTKD